MLNLDDYCQRRLIGKKVLYQLKTFEVMGSPAGTEILLCNEVRRSDCADMMKITIIRHNCGKNISNHVFSKCCSSGDSITRSVI